LKIYLENHRPEVDGNGDHRISMPIKTHMQYVKIVTETIEKTNTRDQRKIKIATLAITVYASILMCSIDTECNHTLLKMRILAFLPISPCSST